MSTIAARVKLFNEAFKIAWAALQGEMLRDRGYAARTLSEAIQREIKAGVDNSQAIAQIALEQIKSKRA